MHAVFGLICLTDESHLQEKFSTILVRPMTVGVEQQQLFFRDDARFVKRIRKTLALRDIRVVAEHLRESGLNCLLRGKHRANQAAAVGSERRLRVVRTLVAKRYDKPFLRLQQRQHQLASEHGFLKLTRITPGRVIAQFYRLHEWNVLDGGQRVEQLFLRQKAVFSQIDANLLPRQRSAKQRGGEFPNGEVSLFNRISPRLRW